MGGYNVRPTEIQAAIGLVQITRLDAAIEARERLAALVAGLLDRHAPWLELIGVSELRPDRVGSKRTHSWMTLPLRLRQDAPMAVVDVQARLESVGVETRPIIAGNLARHPAVLQFNIKAEVPLTESDRILKSGLMIGCHPNASDESISTLEAAIANLASP